MEPPLEKPIIWDRAQAAEEMKQAGQGRLQRKGIEKKTSIQALRKYLLQSWGRAGHAQTKDQINSIANNGKLQQQQQQQQ